MPTRILTFLAAALLLVGAGCASEPSHLLRGRVIDAETREPVQTLIKGFTLCTYRTDTNTKFITAMGAPTKFPLMPCLLDNRTLRNRIL